MSEPLLRTARHPVNWRSVCLGLAGTIIICGLTPYNDYALNNTFLVGNNLPLGVIMLLFLFTVVVNGPLHRFFPRKAFSTAELVVALAMTLTSCALPSSGLMRYFPPSLIAPFWHAQSDPDYFEVIQALHLKHWIFPRFNTGHDIEDWINDPLVYGYFNGGAGSGPVPYWAWLRPALTWGIFLAALYGALLCMVAIVRRQWIENERLAFPLAQIQLALVEEPGPKRIFAPTLRARAFWIAFGGVFFIHIWNGLAKYNPQIFPDIPVYYDLVAVFKERPWQFVDYSLKHATIFFTVVGVTYFLSSSVSFSLWFFYILDEILRMVNGSFTGEPNLYGRWDQHFGGVLAFVASILWVGRAHWKLVIRQAFRGRRDGEPRGRYLSYPFAFWGMMLCTGIMIGWLCLAGSSLLGAVVPVLLLLTLFFVITRVIAETGLVHGQLQVPLNKPWDLLMVAGWKNPVSVDSYYLSTMLQSVHYDFREVLPVYASHSMKIADQTVFSSPHDSRDTPADRRQGRRMIGAIILSLLIGYWVSFASTLWTQYRHSSTLDVTATTPINRWGVNEQKPYMLQPTSTYIHKDLELQHNPALHIGIGFAFTAFLAFMRLRYPWWPLHPIGYIMLGTFPSQNLWFSIFIAWLAKALIVKFGGSRLYVQAKPFFLGLIVGESMAAGFWLVIGIVFSAMNIPYRPLNIMPG